EHAEFLYNTTDYWAPEHERCIVWNDDTLKIDWLLAGGNPILSDKDMRGATFDSAEVYD
ncbi:MAG: dTDP-4-dehydrorhamnose 3,5-epimerase family protein, partial [Nitrosomonas sp.]|nr:dTDP-4-dehydrorhamnose 3,5-epimerase family protein [Nitrosomonas sp.]